jgi:hypothetical protein
MANKHSTLAKRQKKSRPSLGLTGQISFRSAKVGETFKLSGEFSD